MNGKRPLTPEEQTRLLAYLKDSGRARDFLFVLTGLRTGYRARELLSIQIKHFVVAGAVGREILLPRRAMKFGRGKLASTVSGRRMPIHPELRVALEDHWRNHIPDPLNPEAFLFKSREGEGALSVSQAWRMFTRACHAVGIYERVALHSMRKTFAKQVHSVTRDLVKTQAILGHKSPLTTIKYLDTALEDLDAIVCGLGQPAPVALSA